jgi:glycosyltransferase involved in cell wall biosynthesis
MAPSLYEGFGFGPLEAMARGCPVVVARAGALRSAVTLLFM